MNKIKKLSAFFLTGILTLSLAGCLGNDPMPSVDIDNPDPKSGDTQAVTDVTDPGKDTTDPADAKDPDTAEDTVKESIPVVQSGEAVLYNGNIIFREYHPFQMDCEGLWGEFSRNSLAYSHTGKLCSFDPKDPTAEPKVICDDTGYGDMYLINGEDLYSQGAREGEDYERLYQSVYKLDLKTGESEDICSGRITGFSPDGTHFTVYDYAVNPYLIHYYVYDTADTSKEVAQFVSGNDTTFLGMDNENMYLMNTEDYETYKIYQVGFDGLEYCLAECNFKELCDEFMSSYPEFYGSIDLDGDSLNFTVDFYEGTGHFYYTSMDVTVSKALDEKPSSSPIFEAKIEDSFKEEDPNAGLPKAIDDFEAYPDYEADRGFARVIQYYSEFEEGTFFAVADCHQDTFENIGWRESYYFLNLEYCFVPAGKKEYITLGKMFDNLGERGNLSKYDYDETQNTLYVYAGFFYDENKKLVGIYYEPIEIAGPEGPIDESYSYYVAELAEDFYYEYPDWEKNMEDDDFFVITDLDGFTKEVYSWEEDDYNGDCLKAAEYDYEGYLVFGPDDYTFEQFNSFMCHIGFDSEGKVYYIRPVIME